MQSKKTKLCWVFIFLFCLGGCTSGYPIEDLGLVYVLGIDKGEKSHHAISVKIPVFDPTAEAKSIYIEGEGVSVRNALKSINEQTEKHLVLGQTRAVVVGEELAKAGFDSHLDILTRDPEFPLTAVVLVSNSKARDFIKEPVPANPKFGDYLKEALKTAQDSGFLLGINLNHYYVRRAAEGWDPCLPYLKGQKGKIQELGTALFRDDKMVGNIGMVESQLLVILSSKAYNTALSFDDPLEPDIGITDRKYVSVEVIKSKNKVKTGIDNGTVQVYMKVKMEVDIVDNESIAPLTQAHTLKTYEKSFSKEFSKRAERLIKTLQELQVDPLGIGAYLRMQHYDLWKEMGGDKTWHQYWETAEVHIDTQVKIRRFGIIVK